MTPLPPDSFTNPYEAEIIRLQNEYDQAIINGEMFDEVMLIKQKIKQLKSELPVMRQKEITRGVK